MSAEQTKFTDERTIDFPKKNATLEVQMTDEFLDKLRERFNLPEGAPVPDSLVKSFILHATKNALNKINQDNCKDEQVL